MTDAMHERQMTAAPIAKAEMLIRRPVADVFEAFIDPAITSRFWFTKGSGRLEKGKSVQWDWEMYGVSTQARVIELEENKRIVIEWSSGSEPPTTVEWLLAARADKTTFVSITHRGFRGSQDEMIKQAID